MRFFSLIAHQIADRLPNHYVTLVHHSPHAHLLISYI